MVRNCEIEAGPKFELRIREYHKILAIASTAIGTASIICNNISTSPWQLKGSIGRVYLCIRLWCVMRNCEIAAKYNTRLVTRWFDLARALEDTYGKC